jgi:CubicO group peptidase (beta-lactamase class C family)
MLPPEQRPPTDDGTTLEMLATHTSGLPRLPESWFARLDSTSDPYAALTPQDVYAAYASGEGRTPWRNAQDDYSNLGMGLLGHLLERHTGEPYDALVQRLLLEPLGMRETRIVLDAGAARQLVPGRDAEGQPSPPWTFGALGAAGAYRSTIEDMARFLEAAVAQTPIPALDWAGTWTPRRSAAGETVALGWQLDDLSGRLVGIRRVVWHNGGTGGFSSWLGFDPERRIGVVVLAARSSDAVDELGMHLLFMASHTSFGSRAAP